MGLIPDFAMVRDRAIKPISKKIYTILSFGWSGRAKHWQRFEELSLVLAGLATPLVLSVHTIVSMDFATSVIPGWHTTIFPSLPGQSSLDSLWYKHYYWLCVRL
jgi:molybdopterin-containing oxidoreductase family membrane subunit